MKTLLEVADEAINAVAEDFTTLEEHDRRYHDNDYRGGPCEVREAMKIDDKSDTALGDAEAREAKIYLANRIDRTSVENELSDGKFPGVSKKTTRIILSEPDDKGVNKLTFWCNAKQVGEDAVTEEGLRKELKALGYEMKDFVVMMAKPQGSRAHSNMRCFAADVIKKNAIKFHEDTDAQRIDSVRMAEPVELDDARRSELLKRFGVKSVGGQIQGRTADDVRRDRVKRYLGVVGDWEGQSTKEDKESDVWEKRRLQALKREQEAKKAFEEDRDAYLRELGKPVRG